MSKQIPLTRGLYTIVDESDYLYLSSYKWTAMGGRGGCIYAARRPYINGKQECVYMHRLITNAKPAEEVDHKNGNTLDNRRSNLRRCTHRQNQRNRQKRIELSSRFKGVIWDKCRSKWRAHIRTLSGQIFLGRYENEKCAALAYDVAARKLFGEFARLNFSDVEKVAA